eukprot:gnl/TRDRNA2_/TRDRNA2_167934_c0_seq3.p1 gnl/TRDRNA2_/TRDRNA2_167934_c0~~gnl/TRDRNA2_/TRDRNA2_167934_c0_seq3.p1  ORF type:complete len:135 (+),score=13.74 gnl/TRDRNA2_/TRDRNA2_167934_c0_seq3:1-405(+)
MYQRSHISIQCIKNLTVAVGNACRICLVDFEYAGIGQPLMDLAIMAMGCSLCQEEETNLLTAYTGSAPGPEVCRAFIALKVFACLRATLWGVLAEITGASALSLSEAMADADFYYEKLMANRAAFEALPLTGAT